MMKIIFHPSAQDLPRQFIVPTKSPCLVPAPLSCSHSYIDVNYNQMNVSILFRPKNRVRAKIFRTFRESFSNFSPSRKFFRRPKFFSKFSWQRCDSFGPKIVKIGAILTVFRPFEISRKFVPCKLLQTFLCGYKIEMAMFKNTLLCSTFQLPCGTVQFSSGTLLFVI